MFDYSLDHVFSMHITIDPPQAIGPAPEGLRLIFPVSGGQVEGPRLRGRILPCGGDWLTVRRDGVGVLDVRGTIETDDGALIYMFYMGIGDLDEDGYDKALRGAMPAVFQLRTTPRFQTGHPGYAWLNRLQCVGIGQVVPAEGKVSYDIYALG